MYLAKWSTKLITSLRGAWTKLDLIKAKANRAFVCQNVKFPPGRVVTRDGFANRFAVSAKVTSIYNWITSGLNQVIYTEGTTVKALNIATSVATSLFTVASIRAAAVAEGGPRAFIAVFNTSSLGQSEARVVNSTLAGYPADKAFAAPMAVTSATGSEPVGSGVVTAGLHYLGFIMQSRSGFPGRPGPVVGSVFTPASFTSTGSEKLRFTVVANIPTDADLAYPIMTREDNPNIWYFVPAGTDGGDPVALPGGTPGFSFFWDINVSDEDLAARGTEVVDNFDYDTQNSSGVGPFSPGFVKQFGQRIVYIADTDVWISDENNHQAITTALHKRQMPGVRRVITALVIRGILYLIGPTWTYGMSDRGGYPTTWGAIQVISGAIGTLAPLGVTDRTAGDYGWVAAQAGLFLFRGVYEEKPITYLCAEWDRINWSAAYAVEVVDDFIKQRCLVGVPLDSATELSHVIVVDYSKGMTPYDVDIAIYTYSTSLFASGLFSSLGMVQETNNESVLWVGPAASGQILKEVENQRNDQGVAIDGIYETGQVLDSGDSLQSSRVGRLQLSVKGAGTLAITAYSPDRTRNAASTATLAAAPDQDADVQFDLQDVDNFSVRVRTNAVNEWFDLAQIRPYWRGMWRNR